MNELLANLKKAVMAIKGMVEPYEYPPADPKRVAHVKQIIDKWWSDKQFTHGTISKNENIHPDEDEPIPAVYYELSSNEPLCLSWSITVYESGACGIFAHWNNLVQMNPLSRILVRYSGYPNRWDFLTDEAILTILDSFSSTAWSLYTLNLPFLGDIGLRIVYDHTWLENRSVSAQVREEIRSFLSYPFYSSNSVPYYFLNSEEFRCKAWTT